MLRLDIVVGLCKLAGQDHGIEGRMRLDGEWVHADVGNPAIDGGLNAILERLSALTGNAAHQVDADVLEPFPRTCDGPLRSLRIMGAPQDAEHVVIEALHADREPVHAKRPDVAHHGRGQAFGIRLHGAFHIRLQAHGKPQGVKQHGQPRHAHMGWGAAAEIHRRDAAELPFFGLAADLQT